MTSLNIASPCISICKMNPKDGLCVGCYRTIDEIANWSVSSDAEKLIILNRIHQHAEETGKKQP